MWFSRRGFLANAAAAAALPATLSLPVTAAQAKALGDSRRLGSTTTLLPVVGLGSWITFNVGNDPDLLRQSADVIAAFVEDGGGMIDSSPMYGSSQDTIGAALKGLGHPVNVYHADKVWISSTDAGPGQIATSERKWQINKFDLLQVHNLRNWQGHLETLLEMKVQGRLSHVGISTSHGRRHRDLEAIMRDHPIDFVQLTYNPADREVEGRLLPLAQERGIGVIVNRPFQRGSLLNRLDGTPLPPVAREIGAKSWAQLILAFVVSHPAVTVVIPATTKVAHVRENKAAGRLPLLEPAMRQAVIQAVRSA